MDIKILKAATHFLKKCELAESAEDLKTKIRIKLSGGYLLDIFYNATFARYSYTIVKNEKRVCGWDNAPHHKGIKNYPHHFHRRDGNVEPSELCGNPEKDILVILRKIKKLFIPFSS